MGAAARRHSRAAGQERRRHPARRAPGSEVGDLADEGPPFTVPAQHLDLCPALDSQVDVVAIGEGGVVRGGLRNI